MYRIILITIICLFHSACSTTGLSKSDYQNRLSNIRLGMTKSDFMNVFPESSPRGAKYYTTGTVEVMEISYEYYSFMPTGNKNRNEFSGMEGQPQWFYFFDGKLMQYGNPEDWPSEPNLVIENRIK